MREFIYLFRGGKTDSATDAQLDAHERAWDDWMDSLEEEGVLIDGLPMKHHSVKIDKNGAGAWEQNDDDAVSGYLILEAPDMEAAVEMAQECPIFEFNGTIEVRELESHLDELHDDDDDDGFRDLEG
jgi:hypothetical protein